MLDKLGEKGGSSMLLRILIFQLFKTITYFLVFNISMPYIPTFPDYIILKVKQWTIFFIKLEELNKTKVNFIQMDDRN